MKVGSRVSTKAKKVIHKSTKLSPPKKMGRPTKYKPQYCQELIDYFLVEPTKEVEITTRLKNGTEIYKNEERPNNFPFFSAFARKIGVSMDTMDKWQDRFPEFAEAYKTAKALQKEFLIENGLKGLYNATAYIFTAKNITDMRDQVDQIHDVGDNFMEIYRNLPQPKVVQMIHRASKELKDGADAN